jgi:hypothetical protein
MQQSVMEFRYFQCQVSGSTARSRSGAARQIRHRAHTCHWRPIGADIHSGGVGTHKITALSGSNPQLTGHTAEKAYSRK